MKQIPLTQGQFSIVDDEDFEELNKQKWHAHRGRDGNGKFYAIRSYRENGKSKSIKMHRKLMNAPKESEIDHINGNTLDNRKINLRLCSRNQNGYNKVYYKNNKTGAKGVKFTKDGKSFEVTITINGKNTYIGTYKNLNLAARAYDEAAKKYHGEFAKLNNL